MNLVVPKLTVILAATGLAALMGCGTTSQTSAPPTEARPSIPRPYYAGGEIPTEGQAKDTTVAVSFKNDIVPIMKQHCATCHSPGGPGAQEHLFFDARGDANYREIARNAHHITEAIENGLMPKGKPDALSAQELALIKAWRYAGAPLN